MEGGEGEDSPKIESENNNIEMFDQNLDPVIWEKSVSSKHSSSKSSKKSSSKKCSSKKASSKHSSPKSVKQEEFWNEE